MYVRPLLTVLVQTKKYVDIGENILFIDRDWAYYVRWIVDILGTKYNERLIKSRLYVLDKIMSTLNLLNGCRNKNSLNLDNELNLYGK